MFQFHRPGLCLSVIDRLAKNYRVDGLTEKVDALKTIYIHTTNNTKSTNAQLLKAVESTVIGEIE